MAGELLAFDYKVEIADVEVPVGDKFVKKPGAETRRISARIALDDDYAIAVEGTGQREERVPLTYWDRKLAQEMRAVLDRDVARRQGKLVPRVKLPAERPMTPDPSVGLEV